MIIASAISTKTPAAIPTTAPRPMSVTFSVSSALAKRDLLEDADALGDVDHQLAHLAIALRQARGLVAAGVDPTGVPSLRASHHSGGSSP